MQAHFYSYKKMLSHIMGPCLIIHAKGLVRVLYIKDGRSTLILYVDKKGTNMHKNTIVQPEVLMCLIYSRYRTCKVWCSIVSFLDPHMCPSERIFAGFESACSKNG